MNNDEISKIAKNIIENVIEEKRQEMNNIKHDSDDSDSVFNSIGVIERESSMKTQNIAIGIEVFFVESALVLYYINEICKKNNIQTYDVDIFRKGGVYIPKFAYYKVLSLCPKCSCLTNVEEEFSKNALIVAEKYLEWDEDYSVSLESYRVPHTSRIVDIMWAEKMKFDINYSCSGCEQKLSYCSWQGEWGLLDADLVLNMFEGDPSYKDKIKPSGILYHVKEPSDNDVPMTTSGEYGFIMLNNQYSKF